MSISPERPGLCCRRLPLLGAIGGEKAMSEIEQMSNGVKSWSLPLEPSAGEFDGDLALSASIAHEISQPLAGVVINAGTCLRMLSVELPNIAGAQEAARRAMRDAKRATDIVTRLHALFSTRQIVSKSIDLNDALRDVVASSKRRLRDSEVTLKLELADDIPLIEGDLIQI